MAEYITIPWADSEKNPSLLVGLRKVSHSSDRRVSHYVREDAQEPAADVVPVDDLPTGVDADAPTAPAPDADKKGKGKGAK